VTTSRTDLDRIVREGFLLPEHVDQLRDAGIWDGPELVEAWRNPAERPRLADATGMPIENLMPAVFVANLLSLAAPGEAGVDTLLKLKPKPIFTFKDVDEQHRFVCSDRQALLGCAGSVISYSQLSGIRCSQEKMNRFFIWSFSILLLALLGLIVYADWNALASRFGPNLISQLAEVLGRREALNHSFVVFLLLGVQGAVFVLSNHWINEVLAAWIYQRISTWFGRSPRDEMVWMEMQARFPPVWKKIEIILDRLAIFTWAIPIFVGSWLPGTRSLVGLMLFGLLFTWMFLRIMVFVTAIKNSTNEKTPEWFLQARARQAGWMLSRIIVSVLLTFFTYTIWFTSYWLLCKGAQAWTRSQVQAVNLELQTHLAQQNLEPADAQELDQFILDRTQGWTDFTQSMVGWFYRWLPFALPMVSVGLFALACGATAGWFIFINRTGLRRAFLIFALLYLIFQVFPNMIAWLLAEYSLPRFNLWTNANVVLLHLGQNLLINLPGFTISAFFTLGQDVFDKARDRHLDQECPNCYRLHADQGCNCGYEGQFEQVLSSNQNNRGDSLCATYSS
jgi:hypothetical protein